MAKKNSRVAIFLAASPSAAEWLQFPWLFVPMLVFVAILVRGYFCVAILGCFKSIRGYSWLFLAIFGYSWLFVAIFAV